jgi:hypothetical protein
MLHKILYEVRNELQNVSYITSIREKIGEEVRNTTQHVS